MRLRLLVLSCLIAATVVASAQLSSDSKLRIDQVFQKFDNPQSPGCSMGVLRNGKLLYEHGYGMASVELQAPISPKTVFDIGSVSKQFTAMSILLLQQKGKLSLEDDVRKYIPELPDFGQRITLRHLLHHTSGMRDYIELLTLAGAQEEAVTSDADALRILTKQKALNFKPGDEQQYSNSGYFLLSIVVKRASGQSLRDFAQENIFKPLGMTSTQILDDHTKIIANRAPSYAPREGGGFRTETSNWEQTGDGAVQTTIEDLARWDDNFYSHKVGGPKLIDEMQRTAVLNDGTKVTYALGLVVDMYRGLRRVEHGGAWAGYRANILRFPDQHVSVISECNLANSNPAALNLKVADIVLEKEFREPSLDIKPVSMSLDDQKQYTGFYWSRQEDTFYRVREHKGKLALSIGSGVKLELSPVGAGEFRTSLLPMKITFRGATSGMQMIMPGMFGTSTVLDRVNEPVSSGDPGPITGDYVSEELGVTWAILEKDGNFALHAAGTDPTMAAHTEDIPLEPVFADAYVAGDFLLHIIRQDGVVKGITVSTPSTRRIAFERR